MVYVNAQLIRKGFAAKFDDCNLKHCRRQVFKHLLNWDTFHLTTPLNGNYPIALSGNSLTILREPVIEVNKKLRCLGIWGKLEQVISGVKGRWEVLIRLKLKDLYAKTGKTQKEIAEEMKIREATLSGLANNLRTSIDIEILDKLCEYFEITDMNEIITYIPNERPTKSADK